MPDSAPNAKNTEVDEIEKSNKRKAITKSDNGPTAGNGAKMPAHTHTYTLKHTHTAGLQRKRDKTKTNNEEKK